MRIIDNSCNMFELQGSDESKREVLFFQIKTYTVVLMYVVNLLSTEAARKDAELLARET